MLRHSRPIAERLSHVRRLNRSAVLQIRDGSRDTQHTMECARREVELNAFSNGR